jgi:Ser/Thr protein kinase RdoA (MazF antagonist)
MYRAIVPSVLAKYGLDYTTIADVQKGYRNESYPVVLKKGSTVNLLFYKREPGMLGRIRRTDEIANHLAHAGLPVRTRYDPRTSRLAGSDQTTYAVLYNYLPGRTISWEAYSQKHIKLLGMAMSDMHAVLSDVTVAWPDKCDVVAESQTLLGCMETYFNDPDVMLALRDKLDITIDTSSIAEIRQLINVFENLPSRQPLHMDMVRGNVLFAPTGTDDVWQIGDIALTGVIDFEKTTIGHPLFDIARTLAFLLVDCSSKNETKILKYFLTSGYNKRGHATYDPHATIRGISHAQLLDGLIAFFLLHDLYKFLRHTPYESLPDNHHYIRTRNILIGHAMVRYL